MSVGNLTLSNLGKFKFEMLGETVNKELVIGLVGKFWTIAGGLQKIDAESFKEFNTAGLCKGSMEFLAGRGR